MKLLYRCYNLFNRVVKGLCYLDVPLFDTPEQHEVVVKLILDMKHMGHPSYASIDEETVQARAALLPVDGVPSEALKVMQQDASDETHDKLQPQKAATPCDGRLNPTEAGQAFAAQPPRAIVAEGNAGHNASEVAQAALEEMAARLAPPSEAPVNTAAGLDTLEIRTGNVAMKCWTNFSPATSPLPTSPLPSPSASPMQRRALMSSTW